MKYGITQRWITKLANIWPNGRSEISIWTNFQLRINFNSFHEKIYEYQYRAYAVKTSFKKLPVNYTSTCISSSLLIPTSLVHLHSIVPILLLIITLSHTHAWTNQLLPVRLGKSDGSIQWPDHIGYFNSSSSSEVATWSVLSTMTACIKVFF